MMATRCLAGLTAVSVLSGASYSAEKNRDLHIASKPSRTRIGDWRVDKAGDVHITVSKMSDQRYEFLWPANN
jgi:hypothetical protein